MTDTAPPAFRASDFQSDSKPHILLACTGSVATIKLPAIVSALSAHDVSIRIVLTDNAAQFLQDQSAEQPDLSSLRANSKVDGIYTDKDEWTTPWKRGREILHIELRRWADVMLIAPLSANSLAKLVAGMADSLVLSVARAWDTTGRIDGEKKVLLVAPAMNTAMWMHPVTETHMAVLEQWSVERGGWVQVLRPVEKELACGDTGLGAMCGWTEIVAAVERRLELCEQEQKG